MKGVEGERFYFVHSFAAMSAAPADTSGDQLDFGDAEERVTWCTYGRSRFVAAYERGPLFATQFHPENPPKRARSCCAIGLRRSDGARSPMIVSTMLDIYAFKTTTWYIYLRLPFSGGRLITERYRHVFDIASRSRCS